MKLEDGRITLLVSKEEISIEIYDYNAGVPLAKIELSPEQFAQALSKLTYTKCKSVEIINLEKIGKKEECKDFEFVISGSEEVYWKNREEIAKKVAKKKCPKGWKPVLYFNSRNSFFQRENKWYAKTTIKKWI